MHTYPTNTRKTCEDTVSRKPLLDNDDENGTDEAIGSYDLAIKCRLAKAKKLGCQCSKGAESS